MKTTFFKYQGAGNDFVIIDNREATFPKENQELIAHICDRKFGIGADGLMLLENSDRADFTMLYFNADGLPGSMCGNGGRCIVAFAQNQEVIQNETRFEAQNEIYEAKIDQGKVSLKMTDVQQIEVFPEYTFLNTGSPHHISFAENVDDINVFELGRKIRYAEPYNQEGTNVNFVEKINENTFKVRTYERGVEDETLSCGTGVTAVALASFHLKKTGEKHLRIITKGGDLFVDFDFSDAHFHDIVLSGPATFVFQGEIKI